MPREPRTLVAGTRLRVFGRKSLGLTARGRVMLVPRTQTVDFFPPNKYYGLELKHILGPLKGLHIHFSMVQANKAPLRPVCNCAAYPFPHAKGQGKCQTNK